MVKTIMKQHNTKLQQHHHVRLDAEFKYNCMVWLKFLTDKDMRKIVNRQMLDMDAKQTVTDVGFFSDTSKAEDLGYGCICKKNWIYGKWPEGFIKNSNPSIEYLELFALTAGILTWKNELANINLLVYCDNQAVVHMINNITSGCKHCMKLIRVLVLNGLIHNRKIRARFVCTNNNGVTDALSRLQFSRFRHLVPKMNALPHTVNEKIWPIDRVFNTTGFDLN